MPLRHDQKVELLVFAAVLAVIALVAIFGWLSGGWNGTN